MIVTNELYNKYVTDELKYHKGLSHPVKSGILARIRNWQMNPEMLRPNPEDEFTMDSVGPNWDIINNYEETIRLNLFKQEDIFDEPLVVVKLDKGGYMLLNGHHRWMAALNQRVKKVPVKIVNIIQDDDVYEVIKKSNRHKCVTIDFDEVLFSDAVSGSLDTIPFPLKRIYKKNIRENASLLIKEFQRMGYDVWVYTGSYLSEQYIRGLFSLNKCQVDGVVNGLNGKKKPQKLREIFRSKYELITHVDNESITFVNTKSKKYEIIDIDANEKEWASSVVMHVNDFDPETLNN